MRFFRALLLVLGFAALVGCSTMKAAEPACGATYASDRGPVQASEISRFFDGVEGTFVLLDARTGQVLCHNPKRAATAYIPASTFKIPNTLIAMETGVADSPDFALAWNSRIAPREPWWPAAWARDHTLRTALPNSVVWYYQELARRTGPERMRSYLDKLDYGNRNISGGIDQFWLTGGLRISAVEQVDFLRRFYFDELPVAESTIRLVKELLVIEETPQYRLSGKTGWTGLDESSAEPVGWLVGYLERNGQVHFYAMNLAITKNEHAAARLSITRAILRHMGLM